MSIKVLLVEDDSDIGHLIKLQLELKKFDVDLTENGDTALEMAGVTDYQLFIIDRMLPGLSGSELCKKLRQDSRHGKSPIIFVTALSRPEEVIEGLDSGADDYVTKPFDTNVLIARVHSVLRRYSIYAKSSSAVEVNSIKLDFDQHKVWLEDEELSLTNSEYKILSLLFKNLRKVLSRRELVDYVQGEKVHVTERTIDTHVAAIRKKLKGASSVIETIRGVGYRIDV
ncbi:MAG: response regulator transcription factor [Bacteriovoracaceae bacterium]|nr:response regulator transcription factor [Bacteriovoracaceae bacterium]